MDTPRGHCLCPADKADKGGFTCTIAPKNAKLLTLLELEIDVLENQLFPKARWVFFIEVFNPKSSRNHPARYIAQEHQRHDREDQIKDDHI